MTEELSSTEATAIEAKPQVRNPHTDLLVSCAQALAYHGKRCDRYDVKTGPMYWMEMGIKTEALYQVVESYDNWEMETRVYEPPSPRVGRRSTAEVRELSSQVATVTEELATLKKFLAAMGIELEVLGNPETSPVSAPVPMPESTQELPDAIKVT